MSQGDFILYPSLGLLASMLIAAVIIWIMDRKEPQPPFGL